MASSDDGAALSATEIAASVRSGEASATEIAEAALDRIAKRNDAVGAFTEITAARARRDAAAVDRRIAAGEDLPLAGVPFAVKNLYDIEGVTTRAGSKINRDNAPASADAALVARLAEAGAILLGALNMGEYAYDFTGENAHDGPSLNPHDRGRMAGGSSGGSGAAVAAGMVPISLGTDTNGSIRVPASFCGLFGLKPTYGRLSRRGIFPFCFSLDHAGPLGRSARDLAAAFDVLQGRDAADPAQADRPALPTLPEIGNGTDGLRVAIASGFFRDIGEPEAGAAVDTVAMALGTDRLIEIPEAKRARAAAYLITTAESSALHLDQLRTRPEDYDPDTRDRFLSGAMVPAAWLVQAQRFRSWYRRAVAEIFKDVDILLAPATPFFALPSGTKTIMVEGQEVSARASIGIFAQPISFIGLPVVAVPVWLPGADLPIGVQVIAAPWREDLALRVAQALEASGTCRAPVAALG